MASIDFSMEARFRSIERDLATIHEDLAVIKNKLEALPSRWMQWLFALAIIMPLYGILVTLLWTTIHR